MLADGTVLFGLYHPTAAQVHVTGTFNGWQVPGEPLTLHDGWFGAANTWLGVVPAAAAGDEYRFVVDGGVPIDGSGRHRRLLVDPYARCLGVDHNDNNPLVVDPGTFAWTDAGWRTPDTADLILYELSVHGFTDGDLDVKPQDQGRFGGITERIRGGYFDELGVTALSLMPLAEVPSPQGPTSLGYDPSLYCAGERDFGGPDELRTLVDVAHGKGLAVLLDMVFNHTSNAFNPMWGAILEHPAEESRCLPGRRLLQRLDPVGEPGGHREGGRAEPAHRRLQAVHARVPRRRVPLRRHPHRLHGPPFPAAAGVGGPGRATRPRCWWPRTCQTSRT